MLFCCGLSLWGFILLLSLNWNKKAASYEITEITEKTNTTILGLTIMIIMKKIQMYKSLLLIEQDISKSKPLNTLKKHLLYSYKWKIDEIKLVF
jgi:hypothetical protein